MLGKKLLELANQEGFPLSGLVSIDLGLQSDFFKFHQNQYLKWIENKYHGEMAYLERGLERRINPRLLLPEAKSMLCVALPYSKKANGSENPEIGPQYARYLRGRDYHFEIKERLENVMSRASADLEVPLKWKVCVDTSAVLERTWAALAGIGWIGKNSLLIHPQYGSYLLLGEVLMDYDCGVAPEIIKSYCGSCNRCLDQCPTKALISPGILDSQNCISYWTLEKRGPFVLDESRQRQADRWIAGCDVCQEVCPFNTKPHPTPDFNEHLNSDLAHWDELISETEEQYRLRVKNSALKRVKHEDFKRNLSNALKNVRSYFR